MDLLRSHRLYIFFQPGAKKCKPFTVFCLEAKCSATAHYLQHSIEDTKYYHFDINNISRTQEKEVLPETATPDQVRNLNTRFLQAGQA